MTQENTQAERDEADINLIRKCLTKIEVGTGAACIREHAALDRLNAVPTVQPALSGEQLDLERQYDLNQELVNREDDLLACIRDLYSFSHSHPMSQTAHRSSEIYKKHAAIIERAKAGQTDGRGK